MKELERAAIECPQHYGNATTYVHSDASSIPMDVSTILAAHLLVKGHGLFFHLSNSSPAEVTCKRRSMQECDSVHATKLSSDEFMPAVELPAVIRRASSSSVAFRHCGQLVDGRAFPAPQWTMHEVARSLPGVNSYRVVAHIHRAPVHAGSSTGPSVAANIVDSRASGVVILTDGGLIAGGPNNEWASSGLSWVRLSEHDPGVVASREANPEEKRSIATSGPTAVVGKVLTAKSDAVNNADRSHPKNLQQVAHQAPPPIVEVQSSVARRYHWMLVDGTCIGLGPLLERV
jgi:hypothetical protein